MKVPPLIVGLALTFFAPFLAPAAPPYQSSADFEKYARTLRESALLKLEPRVLMPTTASPLSTSEKYPWKRNIVTTIFWVGESAAQNNPVHNYSSSWDVGWVNTFGGYDNPDPRARKLDPRTADYRPANFVPQLNPFYFALPYNDVSGGRHKPEASKVIPWFREAFRGDGKTVLEDRWICVKNRFGKECYAQWADCGPFRTDHWQYVFGPERPKPNLNKGAGLDVSPSVRDFLGLSGTDVTDWRFVEWREVPPGPWRRYGENNHWVQNERHLRNRVVQASSPAAAPTKTVPKAPVFTPPPAPVTAPPPTQVGGPRVDAR
jgi:hypothetical protein